jgi:O-succinylbenzoic acid--CoA ligase
MSAVICPICAGAQRHPRTTALITPQRSWSYRELDEAITQAVAQLRRRGVRRGAMLAVHLPNDWRYPVALFALLRMGVCAVLTNLRLPPTAVAAQLRGAGVFRAIVAGKIKLPGIRQLAADEILAACEISSRKAPKILLTAPAMVLFTSASTGAAKAVALTFGNLYYSALGSNRNIALRRGDRWQLSLPLYHVSGLGVLLRAWLAGAAVVIPTNDDAPTEATHISLVPTQLRRLLEKRPGLAALQRMKAVLVGGAATDQRLLAAARSAGIRVLPTYGLTELASQVCTLPPSAPRSRWFTSGRVLPFRELKLAADGEILVRGRTRFPGYLVRGRLQRLPPARWFATGDFGALDSAGYLTVLGRKDNMFISGGENIQPEEIEQALLALPGVTAAVVVPRAEREFGARPVAFVRCARNMGAEKLRAALRGKLPAYKVPVEFLPWPQAVPAGLKISRPFFAARLPR